MMKVSPAPHSELAALGKVFFAVVVWGASFIATKVALEEISPLTIMWLRFGIGLLTLGAFLSWRRELAAITPGELGYLALLGFVGIALHTWLQATGLRTAEATTTAWIVCTTPVFIALFGRLLLGERLRSIQVGGIGLAAIGVLLVISKGNPLGLLGGGAGTLGDVLILISAPNWALFSVLSRKALQRHPPTRMLFYVIGSGWLVISAGLLAAGHPEEIGRLTVRGWTSIGFLGLFCSGIGYIFWFDALKHIAVARVGSLLFFQPLVAVVVAAYVLQERMSPAAIAGSMLILLGVWFVNKRR